MLITWISSHTHNHFTARWTLSGTTRVSQYQKVHFAIFWIFWMKIKITHADAPTIWMDCHPIQTNWCPDLCHPHHFMQDALPYTTVPIYPGLGQTCIPSGLVTWISSFTSNIFVGLIYKLQITTSLVTKQLAEKTFYIQRRLHICILLDEATRLSNWLTQRTRS